MQISLADLIVLGGCAAVEKAAKDAGVDIEVPFTPGRTDATQELTDVESFAVLEPTADGFRNYLGDGQLKPAEHLLVDKANLLTLTRARDDGARGRAARARREPRRLGPRRAHRPQGGADQRLLRQPVDMGTIWEPVDEAEETFEGSDRATGEARWTASRVDLVFGSDSQLRAIAEVYASDDAQEKFVRDFVAAWDKVMMLDRFDIA